MSKLVSPRASDAGVVARMRGNRRAGTNPENRLAVTLRLAGIGFRRDRRLAVGEVTVRPDMVIPRFKIAIFVDGCFWHSCPVHGRVPHRNAAYWQAKLSRNAIRDRRDTLALRRSGWRVIRIWEHTDPVVAIRRLRRAMRDRHES